MFTYPFATLYNYQNAFMHKSEHRANPILIIYANKVYELRARTIGIYKDTGSLKIQF